MKNRSKINNSTLCVCVYVRVGVRVVVVFSSFFVDAAAVVVAIFHSSVKCCFQCVCDFGWEFLFPQYVCECFFFDNLFYLILFIHHRLWSSKENLHTLTHAFFNRRFSLALLLSLRSPFFYELLRAFICKCSCEWILCVDWLCLREMRTA